MPRTAGKSALVEIKESDRNLLSDSTSGLSLRLASGSLDPRDALREINRDLNLKRLTVRQQAYLEALKRQLIFREFARSALEVQQFRFPPGAKDESSAEFKLFRSGKTGLPIIDSCLLDLKGGLPHNRARLLLARFAIRNLNLDPDLVAKFYRKHLADYCPVINTFNIVSASSGANFGEPCYRLSNPMTAVKKLDPQKIYLTEFGLQNALPTDEGLSLIRNGNRIWQLRWKEARASGEFIQRKLWPTRDKDRAIYFVLDRIPARGSFAPYYRHYLRREIELLSL